MKQTLITAYVFNPSVSQIDFSSVSGFTVERLYAVINITRNQLIYAVGQPAFGFTAQVGSVVTFVYNTAAMSDTDLLEIIYDTANTDLPNAGVTMLTDGTHSQAYTAANEAKVSVTQPLPAGTNNLGSITNITGTQVLPTNAAQESGGHLASIDSKLADDGSGNLKVNLETSIPAGANTIGGVTQSGSWTVNLASGSIDIGKVDQGLPNTVGNAWPVIPSDGVHEITIKPASTAAIATDTAEVVALSPNTPLPSGSNSLGSLANITGTISLPTGAATAANQSTMITDLAAMLANQTNGTQETQVTNFPSVQAVSQSGTWNLNNISGTVSLPTGASTSALQVSGNATLTSILADMTNGTQLSQVVDAAGHSATVKAASTPAGAGDTSLVVAFSPNTPLPAGTNLLGAVTQSGTWNITNISGTVSLPTNAAQETGGHLASLDAKFGSLGQKTSAGSAPVVLASDQSAIPVSQSGSWTVSLSAEGIEIGKVDQGLSGSNAQAWWTQIGDGTHGPVAVKAASTATAATDLALVVGFSPNSPLPAGANIIGAVTQSGTWTTARSWTLASGTDSVSAVQSGAWNITNITGTVSLPTGAATSALQTTGNTSLASILTGQTSGTQLAQVVDAAGHVVTIKAASTASVATDTSLVVGFSPNSPLPVGANVIGAVTQSGTWNIGTVTTVTAVTAITNALPAGANTIGAVTQASGPWTQNITQFGGSAIATGVGASGAGIPRVTVANDSNILATQSGTWNITNISGTVSLPTGAATSALQTTGNTTLSSILTGLTSGTQLAQVVDAAGHVVTIKPASTASIATDTSLVVGFSPNSPLPTGANVIGSVSQNGTWTTGRTWTLASGTDSVSAVQSGTWTVQQGATPTSLANAWPVKVTDGTNTLVTFDAVARAGFVKQTDGTNAIGTFTNITGAQATNASPGFMPNTFAIAAGWDGTTHREKAVDTSGNTQIVGNIASGAADSGNPVKVGGLAKTAQPTAVTDGQRVNALYDKLGRQVVVPGHVRDLVTNQTTTIASSTAETTIISQVASTFNDITSLVLTNATATQVSVTIRDATAGTVRAVFDLAPFGGMVFNPPTPWKQTTVNNNWTATLSVATVTVHIFAIAAQNI